MEKKKGEREREKEREQQREMRGGVEEAPKNSQPDVLCCSHITTFLSVGRNVDS